MDTIKINVASVIVASILASMGIIENNTPLLIAAIIISPIGAILNNLSKDIISGRISGITLNISLLIFTILCAVIIGLIAGYVVPNLNEFEIKNYFNSGFMYHALVGLMLGIYMAYSTSLKSDEHLASPLIGVAIAVTLLPPLTDIGLRLSQKTLANDRIWKDLKITVVNATSFTLGAIVTNYIMS